MKKGTTLKLKRSIFKTCEYGWVQNPIQGLMFELFLTCLHWFKFCWLVEKTSLVSTNLVSPKIALFMNFFYHLCQKLCMCQNSDHSLCRRAAGKLKIKYSIRRKSKSITCFLTDFDSALKASAKNNYVHFRA